MRDLLQRAMSTKAGKIILCLVIAIPLWLLLMQIQKEPEVKTEATIITQTQETEPTTPDTIPAEVD